MIRSMIHDGIDPRSRGAEKDAAAIAKAKSISFDDADRLHREPQGRMEKRQARYAMAGDACDLRQPNNRQVAGERHRHWHGLGGVAADLGNKNATAFRVRGRIEAILGWAKVRGYRSGENPAVWRNNLDKLLPAPSKIHRTVHHAAMPYGQLPAFMDDLRGRQGVASRALEFTVLAAARTGEVLNAVG